MPITVFLMPTAPLIIPAKGGPKQPGSLLWNPIFLVTAGQLLEISGGKMNEVNQILFVGYKNLETGNQQSKLKLIQN